MVRNKQDSLEKQANLAFTPECLGLLRDHKAEGEEPEEKGVFFQNLQMTSFESLCGLGIAFSLLTAVVAN